MDSFANVAIRKEHVDASMHICKVHQNNNDICMYIYKYMYLTWSMMGPGLAALSAADPGARSGPM